MVASKSLSKDRKLGKQWEEETRKQAEISIRNHTGGNKTCKEEVTTRICVGVLYVFTLLMH